MNGTTASHDCGHGLEVAWSWTAIAIPVLTWSFLVLQKVGSRQDVWHQPSGFGSKQQVHLACPAVLPQPAGSPCMISPHP